MKLMKLKHLVLLIVLALGASPVLAQGGTTNTVRFNGFSFSFDPAWAANVNIVAFPGDPLDYAAPGGPEVKHTEFILYNGTPAPESPFDAPASIRVYRTADFAGYEFPAAQLAQLQSLLASKGDLAPYMAIGGDFSAHALPFMPSIPAAQVIRARAQYIDLPTISGISYITIFQQGLAPFLSGDFWYTFQGLSKDGGFYISAMFKVSATMFPAEVPADFNMDAYAANFTAYLQQSTDQLNAATPDQFVPSLAALDAVIGSFAF